MTPSRRPPVRPILPAARRLGSVLLLAVLCPVSLAWAVSQAQAQIAAPPTATSEAAPAGARSKPVPVKVAAAPKAEAKPTWAELTPPQRLALAPLAASWNSLTEAHKRKWLALSQNYPNLPPAEQARVHSRMAEWAALSPQQRTQARLNFAESKNVPAQDKKAMWEAYQQLPPEEKRKLAAGAAAAKPAPPATAVAVEPVPQQKLATVPKPRKPDLRTPRIAVVPNQVDHNTLLPQPGASNNLP
jgi:hypothetical protein